MLSLKFKHGLWIGGVVGYYLLIGPLLVVGYPFMFLASMICMAVGKEINGEPLSKLTNFISIPFIFVGYIFCLVGALVSILLPFRLVRKYGIISKRNILRRSRDPLFLLYPSREDGD